MRPPPECDPDSPDFDQDAWWERLTMLLVIMLEKDGADGTYIGAEDGSWREWVTIDQLRSMHRTVKTERAFAADADS